MLHIQLLGDFRLIYNDLPVTALDTPRLQALLAYLVLHRDAPQSRRHLAFLFWPDSTETQARTNLRHLLHDLKQALPAAADFLTIETQTLQWQPEAPFSLDVVDFESALAQAGSAQTLQRALEWYRGDLLPSCYDDWMLSERERLRQKYVAALEQLVILLEEQEDYRAAGGYAQRLLQADPLHEETYRHLMRLHALRGDRTGIIRTYQTCVAVLEQELGVEPGAETQATYAECLKTETPRVASRSSAQPPAARQRAHNLPAQLTRFIGRKAEQAQVKGLLAEQRLVTLAGPGGSGKTRLALAVAAGLVDAFAQGVWWLDLAPLMDESLVPATLAAVLGIVESGGQSLTQTLADYLHDRRALLILDNCEHLGEGVGRLAETLLQAAPELRVLATSRAVLGIRGEAVWPVPPLAVPGLTNPLELLQPRPADWQSVESVQLFLDRALAVLPTLALTEANLLAIGQICRRLDGIPLAIELAAARVKVLSVQQIAGRLENALQFLAAGSPAALPRQQTLRAMLDWSHSLLNENERLLFRRLAVFAGSFSLEAVEAVGAGYGLAETEILNLLSGLIDKSLVAVEQADVETRFRLHEIVRQYAAEKLSEAGETGAVRGRHLCYFLGLAETAEPHLFGSPEQIAWLKRLDWEHDNLRAALEWALHHPAALPAGCPDAALRLAGSLWFFWFIRGHYYEGRRWVDGALALGEGASAKARGKALYTAASFAFFLGDQERAGRLSEESLAECRDAGDSFGVGVSLHHLGIIADDQGERDRAEAILAEGLHLARSAGHLWLVAILLHDLGGVAYNQNQPERAIAFYTETMAVARQAGDKFTMVGALGNMAGAFMDLVGDYQQAKLLTEESLRLGQELGEKRGVAYAILRLGMIACDEGRYDEAGDLLRESLGLLRDVGERMGITFNLLELASLTQRQGDLTRAVQLLAAFASLMQLMGLAIPPVDQAKFDALLATLKANLDETGFTLAWNRGAAMSLEQAIRYGLEVPAIPQQPA